MPSQLNARAPGSRQSHNTTEAVPGVGAKMTGCVTAHGTDTERQKTLLVQSLGGDSRELHEQRRKQTISIGRPKNR